MMQLIDQIIERLETRRASVPDYRALWCAACFRCVLSDPAVKRDHVLIDAGEDGCRQPMDDGTISECIEAIKAERAQRQRVA